MAEMDVQPATARAPLLRGRRIQLSALRWGVRIVVPVALVVAWAIITADHAIDPLFLPGPQDLWTSFKDMRPTLGSAVVATVTMTLTGFLIGSAIGIVSGLAMAYSKVVRELFGLVFDFLRPVPVFALIPLFILWFGVGRTPQIVLIALGTSMILGVTTLEAIRNVPPIYVRAALNLGGTRRSIYPTVIIPSILPHLIGAVRVAAAASWGLDVAAEFIGSQNGLGYLMINRQSYLDTAGILVVVLIYSCLALLLDRIIRLVELRMLRWTSRDAGEGQVASVLGGG
jgi:ABC-type nitrate/sulfonate/bicarbonate transport system permease component